MRKLASIQRIKEIQPILDADRLELVKVLGWQCVVKKNEFKAGDLCIYFEIDSFLPIRPKFEFLRPSSYKKSLLLGEGFRLKTCRLRGELSQGLCLPINLFSKELPNVLTEDLDVTELLKVKKWDEPDGANASSGKLGGRPGWVEKSDETRIQSKPELLNEFKNIPCYITTKYDGSSHWIGLDEDNNFHFGSHNLELKPENINGSFYSFIVEKDLENKLKHVKEYFNATRVYVLGEWCGQKIQKNRLQLLKPYWYPFTVSIDDTRLGLYEMRTVCNLLDLYMVNVEEENILINNMYPDINSLLERAKLNKDKVYPGECEGIVIRPMMPIWSHTLNNWLSMKVINNEYLLS